jgi:hypothetical protein
MKRKRLLSYIEKIKVARIYADEHGDSHFQEMIISLMGVRRHCVAVGTPTSIERYLPESELQL